MPEPRVGDGVWAPDQKQPNGKISYIDWYGDKEVHVIFYDTLDNVSFEWSQFDYYSSAFNQWIIQS